MAESQAFVGRRLYGVAPGKKAGHEESRQEILLVMNKTDTCALQELGIGNEWS